MSCSLGTMVRMQREMDASAHTTHPLLQCGTPAPGMERSTCTVDLPTVVTQPRDLRTAYLRLVPCDSASSHTVHVNPHTQLENRRSTSHQAPLVTPDKAQAVLKEHVTPEGLHTSLFLVPITMWSAEQRA